MGLWDFLALIIIAGIVGEAYKHHTKVKLAQPNADLAQRIEDLEDNEEDLNERIKTLETIITDDKYTLDREIRSLK